MLPNLIIVFRDASFISTILFYVKKKDFHSAEALAAPQELSLPIRERRSAKVTIFLVCVYSIMGRETK